MLRLFGLYIWEKQITEKMSGSYPESVRVKLYQVHRGLREARRAARAARRRQGGIAVAQDEWMDLTQQIWWIYPDNVSRQEGHPAPFPEAVPNRLIAMYTFRGVSEPGFPGDIVLDPFAGSGTTRVAARRLGRGYIGIELNPDFCHLAQHRVVSTPCRPVIMKGRRSDGRLPAQLPGIASLRSQ